MKVQETQNQVTTEENQPKEPRFWTPTKSKIWCDGCDRKRLGGFTIRPNDYDHHTFDICSDCVGEMASALSGFAEAEFQKAKEECPIGGEGCACSTYCWLKSTFPQVGDSVRRQWSASIGTVVAINSLGEIGVKWPEDEEPYYHSRTQLERVAEEGSR